MKPEAKKVAAITAAITTYLEHESLAKIPPPQYQPAFEISPWRLFGRQELMRTRSQWQHKKHR